VQIEVIAHREKIGTIESHVQQLQSDAKASAQAVIDAEFTRKTTAELLKDVTEKALNDAKAADEKKVLDAKALVDQSTNTWTHRQTLVAIGGFILAAIVGIFGSIWAVKTGQSEGEENPARTLASARWRGPCSGVRAAPASSTHCPQRSSWPRSSHHP